MFCEECGAKLEDGARFCENCGAQINQDAAVDVPLASPAKKAGGNAESGVIVTRLASLAEQLNCSSQELCNKISCKILVRPWIP